MLFLNLESKIIRCKENPDLLNRTIADNQGFIYKCINDFRMNAAYHDDNGESTVAMMAFKEAVEGYKKSEGKFLSFASVVIKRRLIDHYRKNKRMTQLEAGSLDDIADAVSGERMASRYEIKASMVKHTENEYCHGLKSEIDEYGKVLADYGLRFSDLVESSPKSDDIKREYIELAKHIYKNDALRGRVIATKRVPLQELEDVSGMNRKKLERGRKYILAVLVLLQGEYEMISEYVDWR
jgi:RNA polymerase sigma factor